MRTVTRLVTVSALLIFLAGCGGGPSDAAVTADIQSKLYSSAQMKSASVDVATSGGVVTLSGDVPNDAARYEAYKIASETSGVTKVNDHLTVVAAAQPAVELPPAVSAPAPAPSPARTSAQPRPQQRETAASTAPPVARELPPAPAASAQPPAPPPFVNPTAPAPPVTRTVEIPAGTILRAQTIDGIDSAVNKPGETFRASLAAPLVVRNEVIVPQGSDLILRLVDANSAGRIAGRSELTLQLASIEFQGQSYEVSSSEYQQTGASEGRRTAATIGGGAAVGAIIGGIIGGGKGAAIGAGTGAGAGTVASAATKAQQVQIPAETKLEFTLQQPVSITYSPDRNRTTR